MNYTQSRIVLKSLSLCGGFVALLAPALTAQAASVTYTDSLYIPLFTDPVIINPTKTGTVSSDGRTITLPKFDMPGAMLTGAYFTVTSQAQFDAILTNSGLIPRLVTANFGGNLALTQTSLGTLTDTFAGQNNSQIVTGILSVPNNYTTFFYTAPTATNNKNVSAGNLSAFVGAGNISNLILTFNDTTISNANGDQTKGTFADLAFTGLPQLGPNVSVTYTFVTPEPGAMALIASSGCSALALLRRRRRTVRRQAH